MRLQEVFDGLTLVGREGVGDHVDLFAVRLINNDVGEEDDELSRGVSIGSFAQDPTSLGVEGRIQPSAPRWLYFFFNPPVAKVDREMIYGRYAVQCARTLSHWHPSQNRVAAYRFTR